VNENPPVNLFPKQKLQKSVLIVAWNEDASKLGTRAADFLIKNLGATAFGEILPERYFPLAGVGVEDDVVQFPECMLYADESHNVVIFRSNIPRTEWHMFLNTLLDTAEKECNVTEIYTLGAMVSAAAHTMPRLLISVVNSREMKGRLEPFDVSGDTDYETQPGQKPTLSSYLLWLARQRGIQAANLWVPVPYYLVPVDDPSACKRLIHFFNSKLELGIDLAGLEADIADQNGKIGRLFEKSPDIELLVRKLETGEALQNEENEKLARGMADFLKAPI
jgi:predicted ATP-grasp superfamily ATP-dependent carboligase